ncbi:unnamed protein product, partial [Cyprideis torosa]
MGISSSQPSAEAKPGHAEHKHLHTALVAGGEPPPECPMHHKQETSQAVPVPPASECPMNAQSAALSQGIPGSDRPGAILHLEIDPRNNEGPPNQVSWNRQGSCNFF